MQWRGGPAALMASLMSWFAHASGTESSASDSDISDYYYVQYNVSVACEEKCIYSCEEKCTYCMYVSVNSTLMKEAQMVHARSVRPCI